MMNIKALFQAYAQLRQNPSQVLQQLNIPAEYASSSEDAIQYLMNTGRISQKQFNDANAQFKQLQNHPMFKQLFKK